jgi:hypothetical protein
MGLIGRLLAASLAAFALTAVAVGAVHLTAAPKYISLLLEPLSLLLTPGLVVSLLAAGAHDFSAELVSMAAFFFYFVVFYVVFAHRDKRASLARRGSR